ncbi:unnamed protein product [Brassica oleracea]
MASGNEEVLSVIDALKIKIDVTPIIPTRKSFSAQRRVHHNQRRRGEGVGVRCGGKFQVKLWSCLVMSRIKRLGLSTRLHQASLLENQFSATNVSAQNGFSSSGFGPYPHDSNDVYRSEHQQLSRRLSL